jgi:hypothetical protein
LIPRASSAALAVASACAAATLSLLAALRASFRVAPITALIVLMPCVGLVGGPFEAAVAGRIVMLFGVLREVSASCAEMGPTFRIHSRPFVK